METRNLISIGSALSLVLLLEGCASTPAGCDPAQGGYFRGIGCAASGSYQQRQNEKEQVLGVEQARQSRLRGEYRDTLADQEATRAQRRAIEGQYATLRKDLDRLQSRLKGSRSQDAAIGRELTALQNEVVLIEQDSFTPDTEKAARLQRLMQEKAALDREIEMALQR